MTNMLLISLCLSIIYLIYSSIIFYHIDLPGRVKNKEMFSIFLKFDVFNINRTLMVSFQCEM